MRPSELRINSFYSIKYKLANVGRLLCKMSPLYLRKALNNEIIVESINLTEDYILKVGGVLVGDSYILDRFKLQFKSAYGYWYVVDVGSSNYLTKIEYLHELQNFYFVMNGKELEI